MPDLRNLRSKLYDIRLFAIPALLVLLFFLFFPYEFPASIPNFEKYLNGSAIEGIQPAFFTVSQNSLPSDNSFKEKIFISQKSYESFFWGTFTESGDRFTGILKSSPFEINKNYIYIPITGYPAKESNTLSIHIIRGGAEIQKIFCQTENPAEGIKFWRISADDFVGAQAFIELTDQLTGNSGWQGIGAPLLSDKEIEPEVIENQLKEVTFVSNYGYFFLSAFAAFVIFFLPGIAVRKYRSKPFLSDIAFLPLPGFLALSFYGMLLWLFKLTPIFFLGKVYLAVMIGLALYLLIGKKEEKHTINFAGGLALFFYVAICLFGLQYLSVPVEIAQEMGAGSNVRSGMVASPPDHEIPYRTAVYFFHKKKGKDNRKEYFGDDWSVTSRGPLTAFTINAAFNIFNIKPNDPPRTGKFSFPADSEGMFLARIIGIFSNAFILLGGAYLIIVLGAKTKSQLVFCLVWLALSPVVVINTTFLWAKLLAAYFVILALCSILRNQKVSVIGLWMALAYFSHPVGALFIPCAILLWAHLQIRNTNTLSLEKTYEYLKNALVLFSATVFWMTPWLLYKFYLGFPDYFTKYPLGDGRGFLPADGLSSWINCRWENLFYTLVPTAFFFSDNMKSWVKGDLSEPLRWTIQYAKTLPGNLSLILFFAVIWALSKPISRHSLFKVYILAGNLILMLLFWGYSSDGLGRNCLEPLSVLLIIYTASQFERINIFLKIGLLGLLAETIYLVFSGFLANQSFEFSSLSYSQATQLFALLVNLCGIWGTAAFCLTRYNKNQIFAWRQPDSDVQ